MTDASVEIVSTVYGDFYTWKDDLITKQLKLYSAHARNELAMIKNFISEGDIVLDIGAHIGTFSIPLGGFVGSKGRIYSFEADVDNFSLLKRNVLKNNVDRVVFIQNRVVAEKAEQAFKKNTSTASNTGMYYFTQGEGNVKAVNIDCWSKSNKIDVVNFIKIDVEGAELHVLRSCSEVIGKNKPVLYIEICSQQLQVFNTKLTEIEDCLISQGYEFFVNTGERNSNNDSFIVEKISSLDDGGYLFDVLAVHPDNEHYRNVNKQCESNTKTRKSQVEKIENLFLSVGAMKAGTTWLYEQLKEHPDIYFTPEKEIHYFANKVGIENQLNHRKRILKLKSVLEKTARGNPKFISQHLEEISWYSEFARDSKISNDWYKSLFRLNEGHRYCADFSNLYCQMDERGWENVRKVSDNLKVIYTLRDPLDRLWSHYKFHMKWVNREDEALDAGFENFKNLLDQRFFWVNAEYVKNYKLLTNSLNEDELMILYFEDFRENPKTSLAEVRRFIGIEELSIDESKLEKKVNATKEFLIPDDWYEYAREKMLKEVDSMKECGIWHEKWSF